MADKDVTRVSVRILEKEYAVACPPSERADLLDAAEFLSKSMREIRDSGKVVGLDRIAVMAALNIANDMLKLRSTKRTLDENVAPRVSKIRNKIEHALKTQALDL